MNLNQTKKSGVHLVITFFILSVVFLFFFSISVHEYIRTSGWIMLDADITMYHKYEAGLFLDADGNHVNYSYDYSYQYKYGNKEYSFTKNKQNDYPPVHSNKLTCFVNPSNPNEHVLSRTIGILSSVSLFASIGCLFFGFYQIKNYYNIKRRIQRLNNPEI